MAVVVVMYLLAVAGIALDLILYVTIAALFVIGVSIFAAVIRRRRP
ncbi:MAG: hypothetical protein ACRDYU_01785 [Actinomycetes bacterium]